MLRIPGLGRGAGWGVGEGGPACLVRMQGAHSFLGGGLPSWGRGHSRRLQGLLAFQASFLLTRPVPAFVFLEDRRILMLHFFRKVTPITQGRDFFTSLVPAHNRPSPFQERVSEKANLDMFVSQAMEASSSDGSWWWWFHYQVELDSCEGMD